MAFLTRQVAYEGIRLWFFHHLNSCIFQYIIINPEVYSISIIPLYSLFLYSFLLAYSGFTILCLFQVCSKVIQLYMYTYPFFFRFFSHLGYYRILSRVLCVIQQVLVDYLFYIQQCVYVNPKLLIYPSPLPFPLW